MNLNEFHRINQLRGKEDFGREHDLIALAACVEEEAGELAGAVEALEDERLKASLMPLLVSLQRRCGDLAGAILGATGEKQRKAHKTMADVLDAVADCMTYLSLVAGKAGCEDLEGLLARTFNMVSERAGSSKRVEHQETSDVRG